MASRFSQWSRVRILRVTYDRQTNLMTGWKRETKERVAMTSVLAINRSLFFCHKPLNHEDSGTWDGRAIEQAHALKLRACFTVLLFVFSLVVLYLWLVSNSCYFYSFFIFTILIFLQSWIWYSFCQSFFFSVFSFSISRDTCISICLGHYQTFSTNRTKSRSAPYVAFDRYCEAAVTSDFRTTFFFPLFLGCQRMRVTWFE